MEKTSTTARKVLSCSRDMATLSVMTTTAMPRMRKSWRKMANQRTPCRRLSASAAIWPIKATIQATAPSPRVPRSTRLLNRRLRADVSGTSASLPSLEAQTAASHLMSKPLPLPAPLRAIFSSSWRKVGSVSEVCCCRCCSFSRIPLALLAKRTTLLLQAKVEDTRAHQREHRNTQRCSRFRFALPTAAAAETGVERVVMEGIED